MNFLDVAPHWLCPPGEGVFTVHTGSDKRLGLQRKLYGDANPREAWLLSLQSLHNQSIGLLGIPSDTGGGIQRGANWGPLYVREAAWQDAPLPVIDLGDVRVIPHLLHDKYLNEATLKDCRQALYNQPNSSWPVSPLSLGEAAATAFYRSYPHAKLMGVGGDHSTSLPLVRSWAQASSRHGKRLALLHFDAHTDLMDRRLGIDYCFGTWTYHVREFFPRPQQLVQVGIRSTGKERGHWEKTLNLKQYWAEESKTMGAHQLAAEIIQGYRQAKVDEVYISFDIDALDTKWASATGTPEGEGLDPVFCAQVIQEVARAFRVSGADLMEVAPFVNPNFAPNMGQRLTLETAATMARQLVSALELHA